VATSPQGLRALRLNEIEHRARLQSTRQVVACLRAIDVAVQRVSGATDAVLTVVDGTGHCLVADETARSILALWQEIVTAHGLPPPERLPAQSSQPMGRPARQQAGPRGRQRAALI
jgi:hypothetical protein